MSTWIAVLSNNLDGEIRELEVEAESETQALEKLDSSVYGEKWKHYSLVTIKKKAWWFTPWSWMSKGNS